MWAETSLVCYSSCKLYYAIGSGTFESLHYIHIEMFFKRGHLLSTSTWESLNLVIEQFWLKYITKVPQTLFSINVIVCVCVYRRVVVYWNMMTIVRVYWS